MLPTIHPKESEVLAFGFSPLSRESAILKAEAERGTIPAFALIRDVKDIGNAKFEFQNNQLKVNLVLSAALAP